MNVIHMSGRPPAQKQGLLSQLVVPRPIAMITTLDPDGGVNVAPYSYYMPVSGEPPLIAVTIGALRQDTPQPKDTWLNIERTGEFVVNVTTVEIAEHIEAVAREYPRGVSEMDVADWRAVPSQVLDTPSLADSPAHLECRVHEVIDRGDHTTCFSGVHIVLAEVVCITTDDSVMSAPGRVDPTRVRAVGRMGFPYFVAAEEESIFHQERVAYAELDRADRSAN
ncbi:flavin reductase family protein [Streptomyces sp. NBC_01314]|uniref:flavin reductase family protein n=1 Tax=Streptomyces sp. NBC_01314 TaxID=2903821 RepID=UPI00308FCDC7|nr:flavin reductase family protein [Streptomyces sp. NBC_01314]